MPKANIRFIGGRLDAHTDYIDVRNLLKSITVPTGSWFRVNGDKVDIVQGGNIDEYWHSYSLEIYNKTSKSKDGYFEYKFDEIVMIDRCTAVRGPAGKSVGFSHFDRRLLILLNI